MIYLSKTSTSRKYKGDIMKNKALILALSLGLVLTGCSEEEANQAKVSEETVAKALDGKVDLEKEAKEEEDKEKSSSDKEEKTQISPDTLRDFMTDIGEFAPSLARNMSDDELLERYKEAEISSRNTGYWDTKDFFFQELARDYPDQSLKFPLDSVESKYYWKASDEGELTDKFNYERNFLVENGKNEKTVWEFTDKELEDALNEAYDLDPAAYYEDYVEKAYELLTGDEADTDRAEFRNNPEEETAPDTEGAANPAEYENLLKLGASERDYQAFKDAMVSHYDFDEEVVANMSNKDLDLAYTRAQRRLEETGFGDIGLIFDEIGKLYPGASSMYPGE